MYPESEGYIEAIKVKDGETVFKGQTVCILHNKDGFEDEFELNRLLNKLLARELDTSFFILQGNKQFSVNSANLEILQFSNNLKELIEFNQSLAVEKKLNYFQNKSRQLLEVLKLRRAELEIKATSIQYVHSKYKTDSLLFEDSVISLQNYRQSTENYLNAKANFLALHQAIQQQELQLIEASKLRFDWLKAQKQKRQSLVKETKEQKAHLISRLQGLIDQRYIKANINGRIHFHEIAEIGTYVSKSQALFAIETEGKEITGLAKIKGSKSGKIKLGQKAFVELEAYPKSEYGSLDAEVVEIGELLSNEEYQIKVRLPKQLLSSNSIELPYKAEMVGKLIIICESKTLMERLLGRLVGK